MCAIFVPNTPQLDVTSLQGKTLDSVEFRQFMIRLTQFLNLLALAANSKDSGVYDLAEDANNQAWFDPNNTGQARNVLRKVINFGALPAVTSSQPHGITITADTVFTRIYGVATDPSTSFIPIPYAAANGTDNIELEVTATDVVITTGSDRSAYTICYVVLEYIAAQSA